MYAPPEDNWWLLVTALDTSTPVQSTTLLMCLENLRTVVETTNTLSFLLTDYFRGKFSCQDWLRLIAIVLCRQSRIFLKDTQTHQFATPVSVRSAFDFVDNWSNMNGAGEKHPRSIWRDKATAMAFLATEPQSKEPIVGKELVYHQPSRPNYSDFITYSESELLQADGTIAIGCPADLVSHSAVTR